MNGIKRLIALSLLLIGAFSLAGQNISGTWKGELVVGGNKLRIVFNIEKRGTEYTASMDSPDQYLSGMPVSSVVLDGSNLSIEIKNLGVIYKGVVVNDSSIEGSLSQSGVQFPLPLTKGASEAKVNPQKTDIKDWSREGITGTWSGELNASGTKLLIIINIEEEESKYVASMDIPAQRVKGLPISTIELNRDSLFMKIDAGGIMYKGVIIDSTYIEGTWSQSGYSISLPLTKGSEPMRNEREPEILSRPQEPKPPFPYKSEDIIFPNEKAGAVFAGTITIPQGEGPFPAAILVTGSGLQNRDEEIMGHKPFLLIADYLTRSGIAVLRYDDRGFGKSTGDVTSATTEDFMEDALCAFGYLSGRPEIDRKNIGIIGHSEGGTVSFMAAAREKNIAFIVSMAGMAVRGDILLAKQNYDIMVASGISEEIATAYRNALEEVYSVINTRPHSDIVSNIEKIEEELFKNKRDILPEQYIHNLSSVLRGISANSWLRFLIGYDPREDIKNVSCSVFAINGSKDIQVEANINLAAIENSLKPTRNADITIRKYEGLNHLFQHCNTGEVVEYNTIEETMSPEVLEDIKNWILESGVRR